MPNSIQARLAKKSFYYFYLYFEMLFGHLFFNITNVFCASMLDSVLRKSTGTNLRKTRMRGDNAGLAKIIRGRRKTQSQSESLS